MSITKQFKDFIVKNIWDGSSLSPSGLVELNKYFRIHGPIKFEFKKEDGNIIAISTNFVYGSIITSAKNENDLDENIKDSILTSFDVPSSYAKEAGIRKVGSMEKEYALA